MNDTRRRDEACASAKTSTRISAPVSYTPSTFSPSHSHTHIHTHTLSLFLSCLPSCSGPAWIHESLELKFNDTCMIASSVKISTSLDSHLFPGVHYCKLLSPARVVDWIRGGETPITLMS